MSAGHNVEEIGRADLDPDLDTPYQTIDHRLRATRGLGQMEFFTYNHETEQYERLIIGPHVLVKVHAA